MDLSEAPSLVRFMAKRRLTNSLDSWHGWNRHAQISNVRTAFRRNLEMGHISFADLARLIIRNDHYRWPRQFAWTDLCRDVRYCRLLS